MKTQDFLLELGTEELPPKLLFKLSNALANNLSRELTQLKLKFSNVEAFSTPRRLAVLVHDLQLQQEDLQIERKGPSINAPDKAIEGFAKSCGVSKSELAQKTIAKKDYYFFCHEQKGLKTKDLLEQVVVTAIKNIPIAKPMRWGSSDVQFSRPTHWLLMLLGAEVVNACIMGLTAGNTTRGLRFTGKQIFDINHAKDYRQILMDKAKIEVDFESRKEIIRSQIMQVASDNQAIAVIDKSLLNEVCALVEYPCAFSGGFSESFLNVPKEVLISAMKSHQKYFHMLDEKGKLLPRFISIANIKPSDMSVIINGNERVIRPRLADAEFFWEQDKKQALAARLKNLESVLFMKSLGSMADKAKRIESLSGSIAVMINANEQDSKRAGLLCKTDLVTEMVGEFADLQGVMGGYYAHNDGENLAVASAISEHYHPRFSGDTLPSTSEGLAVSIADKIDSIVGIYGAGHKPTGSKDPYALKRAGLGLLRIMIESRLELNLADLIQKSAKLYDWNNDISVEIYQFIMNRLSFYYQEDGIEKNIIKAVFNSTESQSTHPENSVYDWHLCIKALHIFMQNEQAINLVEVNKRIKNILKDERITKSDTNFTTQYDKNLHLATQKVFKLIDDNKKNYSTILKEFLTLKPVIDDFFDNVMINDANPNIKNQRLTLVSEIRRAFLSVADITYLSK